MDIINQDSFNLTFQVISYLIKKNSTGWVSFGLGGNMKLLDIMAVEFVNDKCNLYDMWSKSYNPKNDTDNTLDGTYDLTNQTCNISNGIYSVSFSRKLDTGDKFDNKMEKVSIQNLS